MNNHVLRAAIVAAIAAAAAQSASAADIALNISGASAQRTFWESDLEGIATGKFGSTTDSTGATVCFLTKTNASLLDTTQLPARVGVPDLHVLSCTVSGNRAGSVSIPASISVGQVIDLAYEAEFGSVWGLAPFVANTVASTQGRMELVKLAAGGTQTVTGYSRDLDTATAGLTGPIPVDIGVTDAEPILWASTDNWSYSDGNNASPPTIDGTGTNGVINVLSIPGQGQPTLQQIETAAAAFSVVNGEVFSIVVDNHAAPGNGITNLSTQSIRSIFTGQYSTWAQVPEVGTGGNIVVCRRDHGSGTEVATSTFFTQTECGGNNGLTYQGAPGAGGATRVVSQNTSPKGAAPGNLVGSAGVVDTIVGNPVENYSSNDVKSCLSANAGVSIGILNLGPSSAYTTLSVDGVQANAHNTALGLYRYFTTTWAANQTATTQPGNAGAQSLASTLILDAQKVTRGLLPAENGSFVNNQWFAPPAAAAITSSSTPAVSGPEGYFYVQDVPQNLKPVVSSSSVTGNPSLPTSVWKDTNKSSCTIRTNSNS